MVSAGVSAQQYMENWLFQINYPQIDISLNNSQAQTVVNFIQERFSLSNYDEDFFPPIVSPFKLALFLNFK